MHWSSSGDGGRGAYSGGSSCESGGRFPWGAGHEDGLSDWLGLFCGSDNSACNGWPENINVKKV